MTRADLFLEPGLRARVCDFFEPRAEGVDNGTYGVREGLAFLLQEVLSDGRPGGSAAAAAEAIATVAWSDMSTAFSLWCQRMVIEYLPHAASDSPMRTEVLPRVAGVELLGSTAMAAAMAHYVSGAPLTVTWQQDGGEVVLNGRVNWASNLFPPDFVMVTAAGHADHGREIIVAVPGDRLGLIVDPYPQLLSLQATGSSSIRLENVRVERDWLVTDRFESFIRSVRPVFLLLQSSFCWGLAKRALSEVAGLLRGVNEVLRPDYEALEGQADEVAEHIRLGLDRQGDWPMRRFVELRLRAARLTTESVALEAKAVGGKGYVRTSPTARRFREAAFLPIQAPTEGQLRWELSHCK